MNAAQLKDMLLKVADDIIAAKPLLTEVDSKIGDGDHGIGMEIGFTKVKAQLTDKEFATVNDVLRTTGMAMLNSMGGASGVIFSSMFMGGLKGVAPSAEIDAAAFAQIMNSALKTIQARGQAQVGDKTMVDALTPACAALTEFAGEGFKTALEKAAAAADEGVESTKPLVAKFGRAKSLMERAIGFQDAGATSVAIIFHSMSDWCAQNI